MSAVVKDCDVDSIAYELGISTGDTLVSITVTR